MALDIGLLKNTLAVIHLLDGRPTPEEAIASDVELRLARPLTVEQVREALQWLRDQGWAVSRVDRMQRTLWIVTEPGKSATLGM